jgi:hypothetical protein
MFKQDLKRAWQDSLPAFAHVAKVIAGLLVIFLWVTLNVLLAESVAAVLVLWTITFVCGIVGVNYYRAVCQREVEEREKAYYAKRNAEWLAKYGRPYPH